MPDSATQDHQTTIHRRPAHKTTMLHDRYEPFNRLARVQIQPPPNPNKPLTPFSISDILNANGQHRRNERRNNNNNNNTGPLRTASIPGNIQFHSPNTRLFRNPHPYRVRTPAPLVQAEARKFLRPWDDMAVSPCSSTSDDNEEEIDIEDEKPPKGKSVSPLDALFQMTSKTFDGRGTDGSMDEDGSRRDQLNLFSKTQTAKKRRKSRTAFTNQQIYELEKRFLYQKYLTPADRDEIAQSLALSNAQVITWFQNRRAKLKRDLEELKADVTAATVLSDGEVDLPNVAKLDDVQLFNRHGLKRIAEKKATQVTSLAASDGTTIPDIQSSQDEATESDNVHMQNEQSMPSPDACVSVQGSPDSTTHPKDLSYRPVSSPTHSIADIHHTQGNTHMTTDDEEDELVDV